MQMKDLSNEKVMLVRQLVFIQKGGVSLGLNADELQSLYFVYIFSLYIISFFYSMEYNVIQFLVSTAICYLQDTSHALMYHYERTCRERVKEKERQSIVLNNENIWSEVFKAGIQEDVICGLLCCNNNSVCKCDSQD